MYVVLFKSLVLLGSKCIPWNEKRCYKTLQQKIAIHLTSNGKKNLILHCFQCNKRWAHLLCFLPPRLTFQLTCRHPQITFSAFDNNLFFWSFNAVKVMIGLLKSAPKKERNSLSCSTTAATFAKTIRTSVAETPKTQKKFFHISFNWKSKKSKCQ